MQQLSKYYEYYIKPLKEFLKLRIVKSENRELQITMTRKSTDFVYLDSQYQYQICPVTKTNPISKGFNSTAILSFYGI